MYTINPFTASQLSWNPVDFKIVGGEFELLKTQYTFSNGLRFNVFPFLTNCNDITFNSKSGLILSDLFNNDTFIKNKSGPSLMSGLSGITTLVSDYNQNILKTYNIGSGLSGLVAVAQPANYTIKDTLTFNFENGKVYVADYNGLVLTIQGIGEGLLVFHEKNPELKDYQYFDYFLNGNNISLFASNNDYPNYTAIIQKNPDTNHIILNEFDVNDKPFDANYVFYLNSYKYEELNHESIVNSFLVKYDSSPNLNPNYLYTTKLGTYNQNYLGIFPYENINDDGTYDLYFHNLKNYQNSEYNYSNSNDLRRYFKINSGTNQKKGSDKIYLTYQTNKIPIKFYPNQNNKFYFSPTSEITPLSSAGLIEDGASGGHYPSVSDRLYTSSKSNFGDILDVSVLLKNNNDYDERYLCSWLYGTKSNGEKIWYDRYYNPAYYTMDQALSASRFVYNEFLYPDQPFLYDVPSNVILSPGVYYQYYHVGNQDSLKFLDLINYKKLNDSTITNTNILNITSWNYTLSDSSYYGNNGLTFGNSATLLGNYWDLDGTNYGIIPANDTLLESNNLTVSLWLSSNDWKNLNGYQIFGNYYNSGFGLVNDSSSISPLMTIVNNGNGTIYNFNCRFGQTSRLKTDISGAILVQRMADLSYWIFDQNKKMGYKYDVSNSNLFSVDLSTLSTFDQIETDKDENLYLYDNTQKVTIVIDQTGNIINYIAVNGDSNRIEVGLDKNGNTLVYDGFNTIPVIGNCSVLDNDSPPNLWQVIGANLYKNQDIIATVGTAMQLTCDAYNNIWLISNDDSYTKFDSNGNVVFRYIFSKTNLPIPNNCVLPDTIPNPENIEEQLREDLPFLSKDKHTYILAYNSYDEILVTRPKHPPIPIKRPKTQRVRVVDFINLPVTLTSNKNYTNLCGLSGTQTDQMVVVDLYDNQAYIISQEGQLVGKLNLEVLLGKNEVATFATGGDFTGYQNIRKYKNKRFTNLNWKFQTKNGTGFNVLTADVSNLSKGWHNFVFVFDTNKNKATYYIDSINVNEVDLQSPATIDYIYRTSYIIGATTIKNTLLNNFLNVYDGYRYIGGFADLKLYNIALNSGDVEQLYYSSDFAPIINSFNWNMPVGSRNYVEEISHWFQFQLPTNKSKYYNINIHNFEVDDSLKSNIELAIRNIIGKLSPAHTILNQINFK